jgi:hypothetical protein
MRKNRFAGETMDKSSDQILDLLDAKKASEKKIDKIEKKLSNDHTKAYLLGLLGIPLGFLASILIYASAIGILWLVSLYGTGQSGEYKSAN